MPTKFKTPQVVAEHVGPFVGQIAGTVIGHLCDEGFSDEEIGAYVQFLCKVIRRAVRDATASAALHQMIDATHDTITKEIQEDKQS